ncbi:hypothetical protein U9M48_012424 [Paspalum notatum var. saurae]|uniref:F-box domain-containing protein n=1 Tax=Paspalum notatum var. saurae TaxID=547442 RepID=A0AAQ3WIJ3_PASNO
MGLLAVLPDDDEPAVAPDTDLISHLPDDVLGVIISFLPTKEGARTQSLSTRWRPLWRSAPLNLEPRFPSVHATDVSRILSAHGGCARRFFVSSNNVSLGGLDGWLRSPALDGLQELGIYHHPQALPAARPVLPWSSVSRFSSTLRVVHLYSCHFLDAAAVGAGGGGVRFPNLQRLGLASVTIDEHSMHALLAGCPALSSLELSCTDGFARLRISNSSSLNLKCIALEFHGWRPQGAVEIVTLQEVIVESAPCLERLMHYGPYGDHHSIRVSVISAPRLKMLGSLNRGIARLELGDMVFEGLRATAVPSVIRSVKVLAIANAKAYEIDMGNPFGDKPQDHIECLDLHLKKIVMSFYDGGKKSHAHFIKYVLLNARVLESIKLVVRTYYQVTDKRWIENQRKQLQVQNQANRGARIEFVDYYHLSRPRDINVSPDPFEYAFLNFKIFC